MCLPLSFSLLLNESVFWNHYKQNEKEERSHNFHLSRQSTLEAAAREIINETHSRDLSKWTGNKSLLIGPSPGWRQGGGCGFSSKDDSARWKLQVSRETLAASQGRHIKTCDHCWRREYFHVLLAVLKSCLCGYNMRCLYILDFI